jgi:transposase-like protein
MTRRIQHIIDGGIEKKRCSKCKLYNETEKFGYSSTTWDRLRPYCKVCTKDVSYKKGTAVTSEKTVLLQTVKSTSELLGPVSQNCRCVIS